MKIVREAWQYGESERVWIGRYRNSQNLPHWHYDCELLYVDKGSLDILCNQTLYRVSKGQAFFIDSEQVHYMHAISPDTEVSMLVFAYDIIKDFAEGLCLLSPVLSSDYGIPALYLSLKKIFSEKKRFYEYTAEAEVMRLITEIFSAETIIPQESASSRGRFKELFVDMGERFQDYDLDTAAQFMSMNASYFSRLFHKLMGVTFTQYLTYLRCSHAVELLKTDPPPAITEISSRCGFMTIRNFNRLFKEYTGYAPTSLPENFVMKARFIPENSYGDPLNPTMRDSILLEASHAVT